MFHDNFFNSFNVQGMVWCYGVDTTYFIVMINFHLRRNLLVVVFIIVPIGIVWLFITLVSSMFTSDDNINTDKITNYIEKIDNFALQEFNSKQQLVHFVEAKNYFNFKQAPALLIEPTVTTYNEKGEESYTMTSKRANYLGNGDIKFKGKVDIKSNTGIVYKMHAKELSVNTKTSDLISQREITYFDEHSKVLAEGMTMIETKDKIMINCLTLKICISSALSAKEPFVTLALHV
jgi:LPS export ABC transporter protein LptC